MKKNNKYYITESVLKIVKFLIVLTLFNFLFGCANVPVHMSLADNNYNTNIKEKEQKLPYSVAVIISNEFTDFTLKSVLKNVNMTYDFGCQLGKDLSMTIPKILGSRFEKITILQEPTNINNYDMVIVPSVKLSRISTRISTDIGQQPIYAIEVNLGIIAKKENVEILNTKIKEGGEFKTEIACWTCLGKDVLNQKKISDEYQSILTKVNEKLYKLVDEIVENGK